tara:strand:+ start:987 stop:1283 length:297 start_codon:yes stop_codon:yes gene_type:complete
MENKEQKFADEITNKLNAFGFNQKDFNEAMSREHRTLQQNFTRMCLGWIEHLAETDLKRTDHRNEASVKVSKKLIERFLEQEDEINRNFKPSQFLPNI